MAEKRFALAFACRKLFDFAVFACFCEFPYGVRIEIKPSQQLSGSVLGVPRVLSSRGQYAESPLHLVFSCLPTKIKKPAGRGWDQPVAGWGQAGITGL